MSQPRHKVQVTFSTQAYALVQTVADETGESFAHVLRRAVLAYYDSTRRSDAYQKNLDHLLAAYPEEKE